jgi:hypothetical protein
MNINSDHWQQIKSFFGSSSHVSSAPYRGVPYCSIATIDEDGAARITPISSLVLGDDNNGFYLEAFTKNMPRNLKRDKSVSVLIVNNNMLYWAKSIFMGRFYGPPGIRLKGTVGEKREATPEEIKAFRRPIWPFKLLKGYGLMWEVMQSGREIYFDSFEPVDCGPMKTMCPIQ